MKRKVLDLFITCQDYGSILEETKALIDSEASSYICVANVHMLIEAHKSSDFANVVNQAAIATPDGVPIVWYLKYFYKIRQERVAGMDLLPDLIAQCENNGKPIFIYGGTEEMLAASERYLGEKFPKIQIAGVYSPPFRQLSHEEEREIVDMINSSGAKIVFVALGCPKQEKWMHSMYGRVAMPMIGIGGALPVLAGLQKRAPGWMQKNGLEWLFRLFQEPSRLFKRYFATNSLYVYLVLKQMLTHRELSK